MRLLISIFLRMTRSTSEDNNHHHYLFCSNRHSCRERDTPNGPSTKTDDHFYSLLRWWSSYLYLFVASFQQQSVSQVNDMNTDLNGITVRNFSFSTTWPLISITAAPTLVNFIEKALWQPCNRTVHITQAKSRVKNVVGRTEPTPSTSGNTDVINGFTSLRLSSDCGPWKGETILISFSGQNRTYHH